MARLDDRIAVVFGAGSSGAELSNGRAAALAYARAGATVAAVDLVKESAEETTRLITEEGGTAVPLTADVTEEDDVADAVASVVSTLGVPAVLHNNVGAAVTGSLTGLSVAEWDAAVAVNLTGVFLACKHTLPHMLAAGRGAIVNVSSLASIRHTGYEYPAYMAAKAAVNQLTVSLALTHARHGVRVNAVLPGLIDTPLVGRQLDRDPGARAARDEASPTGRMGSPWDVAHAAVFLASDEAAYINGACLPVDGGLSAKTG
ncbi:SDR family NAD(P)-dependent oxidoreductase [Amycolatopsis jiangsuensis]|uniref:NAD(P)-dependent dehydrogenase (Short-subunit alcohol dehydrogenase family) n=1 Tax=Amycolatopsis jiangsuensis TaxID=1181879 RepID=A0A840IPZ9_9PSEU|nr:SDR family NAD(P)-dependent oxidoreductase [Amycolatopsis jiangsuensis]MBB4684466.1 NAD(P)-dependent dehydrogenase (short-subunit alcohol dehydrogenase family) [Amycolatopsis jiangsuensis]